MWMKSCGVKWLPISGSMRIVQPSLFQPYMGSHSPDEQTVFCSSNLCALPLSTPMEYNMDYPLMVWVSYNMPLCRLQKFEDEAWNITSLIDLEWACLFPAELQTPPYWLTGRPIDDIEHGEHLQTFEKIINEFMDIFEEQEQKLQGSNASQTQIMRQCWNRGRFWYFQAVHSPKGLCRVFNEHIQRRFCEEHCIQRVFDRTVSPYWCAGAEDFIHEKVKEEAEYKDRID